MTELKNSNLHLGSELEQAVEQYDSVTNEKHDVENRLETYSVRIVYLYENMCFW